MAGTVQAATHTINFGGTLGHRYDPSSLTGVAVGDEIVWMGDFSEHPLTLTASPAGAQTFSHVNTGTSFSYTVTVAGSYSYQCDFHFSEGMVGSFSTAGAGVETTPNTKVAVQPVFPNPAVEIAMIHFTLEKPEHVTLQIFDATGKLIATTADEQMGEGFHMLTIDTKQFASGSYQYVLQAGDAVLRREMIVVK